MFILLYLISSCYIAFVRPKSYILILSPYRSLSFPVRVLFALVTLMNFLKTFIWHAVTRLLCLFVMFQDSERLIAPFLLTHPDSVSNFVPSASLMEPMYITVSTHFNPVKFIYRPITIISVLFLFYYCTRSSFYQNITIFFRITFDWLKFLISYL